MASIELRAIWIHLAVDAGTHVELSDFQVFPFVSSFSRSRSQDVNVERLAGGRLRAVRRAGKRSQWTLALQACTRVQSGWLEDHFGETMMVRDDRGDVVFGVLAEVPVDERLYNHEGDLSLTLSEVSDSAEV